jgi:hypothetical protein
VGLTESVQRHVPTVPDVTRVNDCVETAIDNVDLLNALQQGAFDAAERAFDWAEPGKELHAAMLAAGGSERHWQGRR